jgi:hypothetical protein
MSNFFDKYATGGATRPDSFTGMNPAFASALTQMFTDAPPNIQNELRVSSGYRSIARQQQLFDASDKTGHMVARPGHSQHNHGMAADLQYLDPASRAWVQQNAAKYGLTFPMSYEPWHVELAGARGQKAAAPVAVASAGPTSQPVPVGASPVPTSFGDMVAPPPVTPAAAPPGIGEAIAAYMQSRKDREVAAQAEQARRQALFGGGLGTLYG